MAAKKKVPQKKEASKKQTPASKKAVSKPVVKSKGKTPASKGKGKKSEPKKPERVYKINKGLRLYNKLSKDFAKLNAKLDPAYRLPIAVRRKIISETILKHFKGLPAKFRTNAAIEQYINKILEATNSGLYDLRLLPTSAYSSCPYYEIDFRIRDFLPQGVETQVNAGNFGVTKIFNTSNYDYEESDVRNIVEAIRTHLKGEGVSDESSVAEFVGMIMVKPNHRDDNMISSYYLEWRLYINENAEFSEPDIEEGEEPTVKAKKYKPTTKKEEKRAEDAKQKFREKKKLLSETHYPKNRKKRKIVKPAKKKPVKPIPKEKIAAVSLKERTNYIDTLKGLYKDKLLTKKQLTIALKQAINLKVSIPTKATPKKKAVKQPAKKSAPKKRKK